MSCDAETGRGGRAMERQLIQIAFAVGRALT
jgi:hypothetical protein